MTKTQLALVGLLVFATPCSGERQVDDSGGVEITIPPCDTGANPSCSPRVVAKFLLPDTATDCGHRAFSFGSEEPAIVDVEGQPSDARGTLASVTRCVSEHLSTGQAFFLEDSSSGVDSSISRILLQLPTGELRLLTYDSNPSGGLCYRERVQLFTCERSVAPLDPKAVVLNVCAGNSKLIRSVCENGRRLP